MMWFPVFPLLHFASFIIHTYLAVRIFTFDSKSPINRSAALLLACFAIWSLGMMFMSEAASPPFFISVIWRIYSVGWIAFPSFILLLYIYISKNSRLLLWPGTLPLLVMPPVLFIALNCTGFIMAPPLHDAFGWHLNWINGIAPVLFFAYYISFILLGLFFLIKYAVRVKNSRYKSFALVIIACSILSLFLGTYIRVILPEFFHTNGTMPDITDMSLVIMAFSFYYALSRRGLFNITPATAAENIIAGMGEALMLLNDYFEIVYSNEAATTLLGFSKDEFIGMTYNSLFAAKDRTNSWIKEVLIKESLHGLETELVSKSGAFIPVLLTTSLIKNEDDIAGAVCIASDIREMKRAAEELKTLHTAVEQSPSSVAITDISGSIIYCNPKFTEITGYRRDEVLGKKMSLLVSGMQELPFYQELWKTVSSGREWHGMLQNKRKDSSLVWVSESISPIKNSDGSIISYISIMEDITEQRNAQQAIKESYEELKELDTMKSSFTSMVSHELRTPITSIQGFLVFLLAGVAGKITPQQKEYLEIIKNNSDRLLRLINDLLDTAKMESGTFTISKKYVEVNSLVSACVKDLRALLIKKSIGIFINGANDKIYMEADEYRLSQSLINLLNNAIKFSPYNSTITISLARIDEKKYAVPPHAFTSQLKEGPYVFISVSDQGNGIDEDKLRKVFERYYQAENINTRSAQGTGLGLNIVKNIVELHGGAVWAESRGRGTGATFVILLPEI
jgi:PAS domain S-box-containing protein